MPGTTAAYMREYRKRPDRRAYDLARSRAYNIALRQLIDRHRAEFEEMYEKAKGEVGLHEHRARPQ